MFYCYCIDVRLLHVNKDCLLTYSLTQCIDKCSSEQYTRLKQHAHVRVKIDETWKHGNCYLFLFAYLFILFGLSFRRNSGTGEGRFNGGIQVLGRFYSIIVFAQIESLYTTFY